MSALGDGNSYILINARSRTALDLAGGNGDNGTPVVGWSQHMDPTGLNQVWKVKFTEKDENNYQWCKLVNQQSGTILDLKDGKDEDRNPVQGWHDSSSLNSQWLVWPVPNRKIPVHILYNRRASSDKRWFCVDLEHGSSKDNTKVQIYQGVKPGSNDNQIWMLIKVN